MKHWHKRLGVYDMNEQGVIQNKYMNTKLKRVVQEPTPPPGSSEQVSRESGYS